MKSALHSSVWKWILVYILLCCVVLSDITSARVVSDDGGGDRSTDIISNTNKNIDDKGDVNPTDTIIDVLSRSTEFSVLLHHLQRTGLVPIINRSRGATLVAPVNSAFFQTADESKITRELLLYHILNHTLLTTDFTDIGDSAIYESYLTSNNGQRSGMPVLATQIESDRRDGSDNNNENSSRRTILFNDDVTVVEPDLKAGVGRGVVQGTDRLLEIPSRLCDVVGSLEDASIFARLLDLEYDCATEVLATSVTLLLPSDTALNSSFKSVEQRYLMTDYAVTDRQSIIEHHVIPEIVLPQELNRSYAALDGTVVNIGSNYIVNQTWSPISANIMASNGIVHVYDNLLSDDVSDLVNFTPEKYLYGLDARGFVDEAQLRGIGRLIDESSKSLHQTIFAVSDSGGNNPSNILYQIADSQVSLDSYKSPKYAGQDFLLTTKMQTKHMGRYPQRLKGRVSSKGHIYVNSQKVISSENVVGNTSIYIVDGYFTTPPSLTLALGPFFESSYSMEFLQQLDLLDPVAGQPRTYLIPSRRAWENQALVMSYLETNETALRSFFTSLIFDAPVYTDSSDPVQAESLDGSAVELTMTHEDGDLSQNNKRKPEIVVSGPDYRNSVTLSVEVPDVLFDSGVAHCIEQIRLPSTVDISARDLISAGNRTQFIDFLDSRNLSFILDGDKNNQVNDSYTILVPNLDALAKDGFTPSSANIDLLLSLHILPGNPIQDLFNGQPVKTLNERVQLTGRNVAENFHFIQVFGGKPQEVYVISRGDTSSFKCGGDGSSSGSGVTTILYLDKYISPDWINQPIGKLPFRLKTHVAILIGVACGVIIVSMAIVLALYAIMARRKNDEETRPLLGSRNGSPSDYSERLGSPGPTSPSLPIPTSRVQDQREFGRHLNLP